MAPSTDPLPTTEVEGANAPDRADRVSRFRALCRSFPTLQSAPGIEPWDAEALDQWADGPACAPACRHAAAFVLAVWSPWKWWRVGPFQVVKAIQEWDEQHRAAFAAWAEAPWWP